MEEKDIERGERADESRPEPVRPESRGSTTEADEKPRSARPPKTDEDDDASDHGEPDIDHDEIEETVPGHELDVQLSRVHDIESLKRIETRESIKSKVSRVLTAVSRRSKKEGGLRHDPIPVTNLDEGIIGWSGQDDPEMPLNFPSWQKWMLVALLSSITLLTPFASSILSPGIASLSEEFHNTDETVGAMTVSIYLLGYVIGPLFLAPLCEIYGRKPVLGIANAFFCVWQIGCALAPNIASLIVFRFFSGVGGAGALTLGGGVISDLFQADQRGFAMGIWTPGPLFGPNIGPLIGGFVAETIGWRWDFWIVLIVAVVVTVLIEILNKETSHRVLIERKVARLSKELGRDDLKSCYGSNQTQSKSRILLNGLIRPTKMLVLSPIVFILSLYIAFVYGVLYLLFTTIPVVFETTYGFNVGLTGLVYLALGVGNMIGWAVVTFYSDRTVIRLAKANGGKFEPEMRLATTIGFGAFLPITFFWYGWCTEYEVHWASAVISLIPYGFGVVGLFLPVVTYLVDCYPMYAASAIAANTVLRSLLGAFLPLAGSSMYASLGLGWGNSLLGFICIAMIPFPIIFYKYGARLRKAQRFKL